MPVCPKCGKLISDKKLERHIRRHGIHHKKEPVGIYVPSATPSFEGVERGVLPGPDRGWTKRKRKAIQWAIMLGLIAITILFIVLRL